MNIQEIFGSIWKRKKVLFSLVLLSGFGYWYFTRESGSEVIQKTTYETGKVQRGDIVASVSGSGQIYARSQVSLQSVAAGDAIDVVWVYVKNDQVVRKGDPIVSLDSDDAEKAVRNALLSLQSAEVKMRQTKRAAESRDIDDRLTRQLQEVAVNQARNALADAQETLRDYTIRAPFDGIVTGLSVEVGDSVSRDDVIASVITPEQYVKIPLNEVDAASVAIGNGAVISVEAFGGKALSGSVSKIDTIGIVTQGVVTYNAEIEFEKSSDMVLKPGMSVNVTIVTAKKSSVVRVPLSALQSNNGDSYVLVPTNENGSRGGVGMTEDVTGDGSRRQGQRATNNNGQNGEDSAFLAGYERRTVETGISNEMNTEIVSGLTEGETIVTRIVRPQTPTQSSSNLFNFRGFSGGQRR